MLLRVIYSFTFEFNSEEYAQRELGMMGVCTSPPKSVNASITEKGWLYA